MKAGRPRGQRNCLTPDLERRLAGYGAAAGALLIAAPAASGSIVLWDAINQSNGRDGSLYFDLLSGQVDTGSFPGAQFRVFEHGYSRVYHTTFTFNCRTSHTTSGGSFFTCSKSYPMHYIYSFTGSASRLQSSAGIVRAAGYIRQMSSQTSVRSSSGLTYAGRLGRYHRRDASQYSVGGWYRGNDGYLGLKFVDGNGTHLGWAQITINNDYTVTLLRMAYEKVPGEPIRTAQTSSLDLVASDVQVSGTDLLIHFQGNAGWKYHVQQKAPADTSWTDLPGSDYTAGSDGDQAITVSDAEPADQLFYRVVTGRVSIGPKAASTPRRRLGNHRRAGRVSLPANAQ